MSINFISGLSGSTRTLAPDTGGAVGASTGTGVTAAAVSTGTAPQSQPAVVTAPSSEPMDINSRLMSLFNAPEQGAGNIVDTPGQQPTQPITPIQPSAPAISAPSPSQTLLLGRFQTPDDMANAYRNLESDYTRKSQELSNLRKQHDSAAQLPQQPLMPMQQTQTPEDRAAMKEKLLERFYEDPVGVFEEMQQKAVETATHTMGKTIAPISEAFTAQQKTESTNKLAMEFTQKPENAGWQEFQDDMKQIIETYPEMKEDPDVFNKAYMMAKGMRYKPQDVNSMLQDPNILQQLTANEGLKNTIINNHLAQVSGVNNNIPPAIGNQGGMSFAPPPNKPKTFDEARERTMSLFGQ